MCCKAVVLGGVVTGNEALLSSTDSLALRGRPTEVETSDVDKGVYVGTNKPKSIADALAAGLLEVARPPTAAPRVAGRQLDQ